MGKKSVFMYIAILLMMLMQSVTAFATYKVACLGDSNTYGLRVDEKDNYVSNLQNILGSGYEVKNFGVNNASVERGSALCYAETEEYKAALEYDADIYIIMIGTNDAKDVNYSGKASFVNDYMHLVNTVGRRRTIISNIPPVNYKSDVVLTSEYTTPQNVTRINELVTLIAMQNKIPYVDNNKALSDNLDKSIYKDGVHLMPYGHRTIAKNLNKAIKDILSNGK